MLTTNIYALVDPNMPDVIRYVGKANNTKARLKEHIQAANNGIALPVYNWIRKVIRQGRVPQLQLVEITPVEIWQERERYWIAFYKTDKLMNATIGGDGGRTPDVVTKEKLRIANLGKKRSAESVAKAQATKKANGYTHNEETKAKISAANKGRVISAEVRANMSKRLKGRINGPPTAETKAKISAANKGRVLSAEIRERMSANSFLKGKSLPEETKAKIREKLKGRILTPYTKEIGEKLRAAWDRRRLVPFSEETRAKMSATRKGRKFTPEHCEKIRQGKLGKKRSWKPSEEQIAAARAATKGQKISKEAIAKRQASRRANALLKGKLY